MTENAGADEIQHTAHINLDEEPKADAEDTPKEEDTPEPEIEAESPPADEQNVEEKIDPKPGDIEYTEAVSDRVGKLTAEAREADERTRKAEARVAELEGENADLNSRLTAEPEKTLADFDHDESAYAKYRYDLADKRTDDKFNQRMAKHDADTARNEVEAEHREREKAFKDKVSDYETVAWNPDLLITQLMFDEIAKSEISPEVGYYLGKNMDEANGIIAMSPANQVAATVRLIDRLQAERDKPKKVVSDAPAPPPKIPAGESGLSKKIDDPGLSDKQFATMRRKQIANR